MKKVSPLIRTLYIRDPSRKNFKVTKYDRQEMEMDLELMKEAYHDIVYD